MVSRNSVKTHGLDSIDPSALEIWLVDLFSTPNILKSFRGFSTNIRTFIRENIEHHFSLRPLDRQSRRVENRSTS